MANPHIQRQSDSHFDTTVELSSVGVVCVSSTHASAVVHRVVGQLEFLERDGLQFGRHHVRCVALHGERRVRVDIQ